MTATRLDITIEQGADYDGSFALAFDPTGYSAAMQIKLTPGFPYAILTLTTANGGLIVDGPNREVTPVIPASVSAAIKAGRYLYDLKLVAQNGKTTRTHQGAAYVSAEVTDYVPPIDPTVGLLMQDGSVFAFQDGSGLTLSDGTGVAITSLIFEDGSLYVTQDNSTLQIA